MVAVLETWPDGLPETNPRDAPPPSSSGLVQRVHHPLGLTPRRAPVDNRVPRFGSSVMPKHPRVPVRVRLRHNGARHVRVKDLLASCAVQRDIARIAASLQLRGVRVPRQVLGDGGGQ